MTRACAETRSREIEGIRKKARKMKKDEHMDQYIRNPVFLTVIPDVGCRIPEGEEGDCVLYAICVFRLIVY